MYRAPCCAVSKEHLCPKKDPPLKALIATTAMEHRQKMAPAIALRAPYNLRFFALG
jgi:hypothetical protein